MIKEFFEDRPALSVRQIEWEAGLPAMTLQHYLKGRRQLNDQHIKRLMPVLRVYGLRTNFKPGPKGPRNKK